MTDRVAITAVLNEAVAFRSDAFETPPQPMTSVREKVVKIGAKVVAHGRYLVFQMADDGPQRVIADVSCGPLNNP
jgi:hypothetical protein